MKDAVGFWSLLFCRNGPAIRNANRGDSRESIAQIDSQKNLYFRNVRAIRAPIVSNLRFAIFSPSEARFAKKRGSVREARNDSRESGDSRESANRFARIGPAKHGRDDGVKKSTLQEAQGRPGSLGDPTAITRPPSNTPRLSRDTCHTTPVALCFRWYRRLSLLHAHFFL